MISEYELEKIDIEEILDEYNLKYSISTTGNANFNCPFHGEKNPSCGINLKTGLFKCFACGESGNITMFVAKMDGVPLQEAENKIKRQFIEKIIDPNSLFDRVHKILNKKDEPISEAPRYHLWYLSQFVKDYTYMRNRGISDETCEHFHVIYDPKTKFQGFPAFDQEGKLVGITGRNTQNTEPRYSPLLRFKKSGFVYNLHQINPKEPVIAVEGEINCMAMYQAGYKNTVAFCGAGVSMNQIEILKNSQIEHLIIFFDSDEAGEKGMFKLFTNLWAYMKVQAVVKHEKDAAEMIKEEIDNLMKTVEDFSFNLSS